MSSKANVATRSAAMQKVVDEAKVVRDLCGGTAAMRKAGETYLPKKEAETQSAYNVRLSQSFLYNKTNDTIEATVDKLFANEVTPDENFTDVTVIDTVDMEGRDITRFGRDWLRDALVAGVSYVMVDFPEGKPAESLAIERSMGLRPYCSIINADNILSFKTEMRGSQTILTRINIFESAEVETDNEFEELFVDQVRVLRLTDVTGVTVMTYELWRKRSDDKGDWYLYQEPVPTSINFIPIVPLYTSRTGFMTGRPPFRDIADKNIQHWQSSSSQKHILDFVRFPILFGKGLIKNAETGSIEIGANRLIEGLSDENSDLKHVEHSGAGIQAGKEDLENIEQQMDALSKQMLTRRTGNITATARAIDEASATSDIQQLANIVQDTLNLLIQYMGAWTNTEYGTVSLNADFTLNSQEENDTTALKDALDRGVISKEWYANELKRRGILHTKFDFETDQAMIDTTVVD